MSTRSKRTRSSAAAAAATQPTGRSSIQGGYQQPHYNQNGGSSSSSSANNSSKNSKRRRTGTSDSSTVDLGKLDIGTLRKYQRHYGLRTKSNKTADKEELARAVAKHFAELTVDEEETIESFVSTLMRTTH